MDQKQAARGKCFGLPFLGCSVLSADLVLRPGCISQTPSKPPRVAQSPSDPCPSLAESQIVVWNLVRISVSQLAVNALNPLSLGDSYLYNGLSC